MNGTNKLLFQMLGAVILVIPIAIAVNVLIYLAVEFIFWKYL